jgi:hypothetical protein
MFFRYRFVWVIAFLSLLVFTGCGGSSSQSNPSLNGNFSNASLNGSYAFSFSGTNSFGFFALAGRFQANGSGTLSAGVLDINSGGGIFTNLPFTGTYVVRGNGQGSATLVTSLQNFNIDFVMINTQRALVMRFDNNATASGSMDLQNAAALTNTALQGTFAFSLSGVDAAGNTFDSVGAIDNDGAGNIPSGVQDNNDNGTPSTNLPVTGTYAVSSNGRGTMALNTSLGVLNFAFYVVDGNRLVLMEIDTAPVLAGEAFRQQFPQSTATVNGPFAFTLGGAAGAAPLVEGGVIVTNGSGTVTSGFEDINNNGSLTQNLALSGTYVVGADGRGTLSVSNGLGTANFVIYPTVSGVVVMQTDFGIVNIGSAFAQTGAPFSNASVQGGFGATLSGVTASGEIESTAQFTANGSGTLNGAVDFNNAGVLSSGLTLSGTYTMTSSGRGTAALHSTFGTQNIIFYMVNNSRAVFIDADSAIVAVGAMEHQ